MENNINNKIQILINKYRSGRFQEVIQDSLPILKKNENDFLWNLIGLSFQNLNQLEKSIESFEIAVKINRQNFSAVNNLGISEKRLMNFKNAENYFLLALEKNRNYVNGLVNIGNLKNELFFFDEAIKYYEQSLKIDKNNPTIYLNLANIYQSINKINKASQMLKKALYLKYNFTEADQKLSLITNYNENDEHLKIMMNKLKKNEITEQQKIFLYFGISKALEDKKNYSDSILYIKKANKSMSSFLGKGSKNFKNLVTDLKKLFENVNQEEKKVDNKQKIIFIVGMPRSGTTLLEKIISSHSKVSSVSEINAISNIFKYKIKDFNIKEINLNDFKEAKIYEKYISILDCYNIKNENIIDKSLSNFWYIGFIIKFFPNIKIIHNIRNRGENCLSIFKNIFDKHESWYYNEEDLVEYYNSYSQMMKFWKSKFSDNIFDINYEDLINSPEKKTKELIKFCDLNWEKECLNHHKNNTPVRTISVNQANQAIYRTSLETEKIYKKEFPILFNQS